VHKRYRQTTDRRQTDGRRHIANMNMSSRSLKMDIKSVIRRVGFNFDNIWSPALMGIVPFWQTAIMAHKHTHTLSLSDWQRFDRKIHVIAGLVVHRLIELYYKACILELAVGVYYRMMVMFFCTFAQMHYLVLNVKRTAADCVDVLSFIKYFAADDCVGSCKSVWNSPTCAKKMK